MPIIQISKYFHPYLVYNAPVNEKTQEIRDKFKIDETSGITEHYNFRSVFKLPKVYKPQDIYNILDPIQEERLYSTRFTTFLFSLIFGAIGHFGGNYYYRAPIYSKPWRLVLFVGGQYWVADKLFERTYRKEALKNASLVDYCEKFPERIAPIERYKAREVLLKLFPVR